MKKFRVEIWRIVKYLLISSAMEIPLGMLNTVIMEEVVASSPRNIVEWVGFLYYAHKILVPAMVTLLNRYFTFRATTTWYIALPVMLAVHLAELFLSPALLTLVSALGSDALYAASSVSVVLWPVLIYLLQRCVLYRHTTDQNGWYRRFHTDEKGE